ncbi:MAG: ABC transporter [Deltaproteobacteria bacterium]|nr:MAG: ABC transporter [Deltaproteobacteria bacterium]
MLRLQDIRLTLGDFRLHNISLHTKPGEYMVLLGPTGTGKTVLLETIAGMHQIENGRIFIHGKDATCLPPEKRNLGVVYQDYALFPHLTVRKNIAFGLELRGEPRPKAKEAVEKVANFLDIGQILDRRPVNLSGGERQRVALARALVLEPYVLLLDEPLSALDRSTRDRLRRELKRIHKELGVTIVHITHDLTEAFFLADHLAVMKDGNILQEGRPQDVLKRPRNRVVAELLGIENFIPLTMGTTGGLLSPVGPIEIPPAPVYSMESPKGFYLTVPGWCVEVFPQKGKNQYAWTGEMKILAVNFMDGHLELELGHSSGQRLRTSLSKREMEALSVSFEIGESLSVALLREGLHVIPRS